MRISTCIQAIKVQCEESRKMAVTAMHFSVILPSIYLLVHGTNTTYHTPNTTTPTSGYLTVYQALTRVLTIQYNYFSTWREACNSLIHRALGRWRVRGCAWLGGAIPLLANFLSFILGCNNYCQKNILKFLKMGFSC